MHRLLGPTLLLSFLVLSLACPVALDDPDGGPGDGGAPADDGGQRSNRDAGSHFFDAGFDDDSGLFYDAGLAAEEAGILDAGNLPDAGDAPDAGNIPDAGNLPDAGNDPDAGDGVDAGAAAAAYYDGIDDTLTQQALVLALHALLFETHQRVAYDDLNDAYLSTDGHRSGCDGIFDFYSNKCWGLEENFRCGSTFGFVGRCWNKEHSWPKSWWGGGSNDALSDLFAVIPSDGQVNNRRSNFPFGEVDQPLFGGGIIDGVYVGAKMGPCVTPGFSGNCFEPRDDVKGDLARGYFYMAVRYEGQLSGNKDAVVGADIRAWQETLLRDWHLLDPVDDDERARNEAVFPLQGNRNPFIDHPEWVGHITDF